MNLFLYIYIYIYIYIYVYIYIYIYSYMYINIYMWIYIYIYMYIYIYLYMYVYIYIYIYICMYIFIYVCLYIYIYICMYIFIYVCLYIYLYHKHTYINTYIIYIYTYIYIYKYVYIYISIYKYQSRLLPVTPPCRADPKNELRDVLAVVHHDGRVHWVPHQIFKSSCSVDVTNFPFDHQNCHMWFGSWTHASSEIDLNMAFSSGIDLSTFQSDYLDSSDWKMEATTAHKDIMPSVNDTPNFGVLKIQLNMKRKLVFSSYILTLPCVFLACLTLVVFWLPPDRPDRTALGR